MSEDGELLGKVRSERLTVTRSGRVMERGSSGVVEDGSWSPAFPGQRPPFANGNTLALTHGARSLVEIRGRAAEVAEGLREALRSEGIYRPAFEASIAACSIALVRVERAAAALDAAEAEGEEAADQLYVRLRGWVNASTRHLSELGLTPRSLAALAKDTGLASYTRTQAAMRELEAHLEAVHGEGKS